MRREIDVLIDELAGITSFGTQKSLGFSERLRTWSKRSGIRWAVRSGLSRLARGRAELELPREVVEKLRKDREEPTESRAEMLELLRSEVEQRLLERRVVPVQPDWFVECTFAPDFVGIMNSLWEAIAIVYAALRETAFGVRVTLEVVLLEGFLFRLLKRNPAQRLAEKLAQALREGIEFEAAGAAG